jgi:cephalosporin hydroxylase
VSWQDVPGFFDFQQLYLEVVALAPKGATLVEVGVFLGRSLAFLASAAIDAGRDDLRIVGVDSFVGLEAGTDQYIRQAFGSIENACRTYLRVNAPAEYARIELDVASSVEAAERYAPWFTFIDAAHDYDNVRADLEAWDAHTWGAIAGHDYLDCEGVKRAVDERYGKLVQRVGGSWFVSKRRVQRSEVVIPTTSTRGRWEERVHVH